MSFSGDIEKFADKAMQNFDTVLRSVSLQMGTALIVKSPVDTGRFRMNWNFSIGSADTSTDTESPPKDIGFVLGKMQATVSGFKAGQILYFTNNLDYAVRLEYGHSEQAPSGMVRTTYADFGKYLKKALKELK